MPRMRTRLPLRMTTFLEPEKRCCSIPWWMTFARPRHWSPMSPPALKRRKTAPPDANFPVGGKTRPATSPSWPCCRGCWNCPQHFRLDIPPTTTPIQEARYLLSPREPPRSGRPYGGAGRRSFVTGQRLGWLNVRKARVHTHCVFSQRGSNLTALMLVAERPASL